MMVHNAREFEQAVNFLKACPKVSFDTETTGLMPYKNHDLFALVMTGQAEDGECRTYYWNFMDYNCDSIVWPKTKIKMLQPIFNRGTRFAHNAIFDMHFLSKHGIEFPCDIHCTMIQARVLRNDYQSYSLDSCVSRELGLNKDDAVEKYIEENKLWDWVSIPGKTQRDKNKKFYLVPQEIIQPYAEKDAELCLSLGLKQEADFLADETACEISGHKSLKAVRENEMRLTKVCFAIEREGFLVDLEYCEKAIVHEDARIKAAELAFLKDTGEELTDSGDFLAPHFERIGFPLGLTEKGNYEVQDSFLEATGHPLAKIIQEYRDASKRSNTYFKNYRHYADAEGRIHAGMKQAGTKTGRFSYQNPNCLSMDTEVLTEDGWKGPKDITKADLVFCYDLGLRELVKSPYSRKYISEETDQTMVTIKNEHFDLRLTANHRCLFRDRKTEQLKTIEALDWMKDAHVLHGAKYLRGFEYQDGFIKLALATQADGHFTAGKQVVFAFRKQRKITRLCEILERLHTPYKLKVDRRRVTTITIQRPDFCGLLTADKCLTFDWLSLSFRQRKLALEEIRFWDGNSTRARITYCSMHKKNVDVLQAVAASVGWRCHFNKYKNKYWILYICPRDYSGTANSKVIIERTKERVWCLEVPTGYMLCRRGNDTFITGNCQNIPKLDEDTSLFPIRNAFPAEKNHTLVMIDYNQMEFRMMLDYAKQNDLIRQIQNGHDPHQATSDLTSLTRRHAKILNFGLLYGMGLSKLAFSMKELKPIERVALIAYDRLEDKRKAKAMLPPEQYGIVKPILDEMKTFKSTYFEALPMVESLIQNCTNSAIDRGWVFNWMGRRFHFEDPRFAYRATNSVIQGGCADVVKKAMVTLHPGLPAFGAKMVLTIHDELLLQVPNDELRCVGIIKETMESIYPHAKMQLTCSVSHSQTSWGDAEEGLPDGKEKRDSVQGSFFEGTSEASRHLV